ncbi:MAG: peptidoglycan-binding protein [Alphaproteobacteria bacterium]|nr:peptidoglycan-binding protein [Alphaproteobacteria bacterium]
MSGHGDRLDALLALPDDLYTLQRRLGVSPNPVVDAPVRLYAEPRAAEVRRRLSRLGYPADGLRQFQEEAGLQADGHLDPASWGALASLATFDGPLDPARFTRDGARLPALERSLMWRMAQLKLGDPPDFSAGPPGGEQVGAALSRGRSRLDRMKRELRDKAGAPPGDPPELLDLLLDVDALHPPLGRRVKTSRDAQAALAGVQGQLVGLPARPRRRRGRRQEDLDVPVDGLAQEVVTEAELDGVIEEVLPLFEADGVGAGWSAFLQRPEHVWTGQRHAEGWLKRARARVEEGPGGLRRALEGRLGGAEELDDVAWTSVFRVVYHRLVALFDACVRAAAGVVRGVAGVVTLPAQGPDTALMPVGPRLRVLTSTETSREGVLALTREVRRHGEIVGLSLEILGLIVDVTATVATSAAAPAVLIPRLLRRAPRVLQAGRRLAAIA